MLQRLSRNTWGVIALLVISLLVLLRDIVNSSALPPEALIWTVFAALAYLVLIPLCWRGYRWAFAAAGVLAALNVIITSFNPVDPYYLTLGRSGGIPAGRAGRLCPAVAVDLLRLPSLSRRETSHMKSASANTLPKLDESKCKAIGICIEACPERAIEMRGFHLWVLKHEHAVLAHPQQCTGCGVCVEACPVKAWNL